MILADICTETFLTTPSVTTLKQLLDLLLEHSVSYVLVLAGNQVEMVFSSQDLMEKYLRGFSPETPVSEIPSFLPLVTAPSSTPLTQLMGFERDTLIIATEDSVPVGIAPFTSAIQDLALLSATHLFDMPFHSLQQVFDSIEEEIIVSTGNGTICYMNPKAEALIDVPAQELIGRNLKDVVKEKLFYPSAALEVLKTHKKVDMHTYLQTGEERLSTALPIFDSKGNLQYTVCTSKNVNEILLLNERLQSKKKKLQQMNLELERMQKLEFEQMDFYFDSPKMFKVMKSIRRAAPLDMTVLVQGETGVGKELIAKSIHYLSPRHSHPFIKINCGLIPENLIEAELFGYENGAFTGAAKGGKKGKVELADGGTLFLDEIGDMPYHLQIKLLDFLQDSSFVRVGGTKRLKADVRIISATNRDLNAMVADGTFRMDLFYRLNVFSLQIPPLRERMEDIPCLIEYFIKKFNSKYKMNRRLSPSCIQAMYQYSWPGNVRELEHALERMLVMSDSDEITSDTLKEALDLQEGPSLNILCNGIMPYKEAKRQLEKLLVERAYAMYGSTYKAAAALEIDQSTVAKLLKKHSGDLQ